MDYDVQLQLIGHLLRNQHNQALPLLNGHIDFIHVFTHIKRTMLFSESNMASAEALANSVLLGTSRS